MNDVSPQARAFAQCLPIILHHYVDSLTSEETFDIGSAMLGLILGVRALGGKQLMRELRSINAELPGGVESSQVALALMRYLSTCEKLKFEIDEDGQ